MLPFTRLFDIPYYQKDNFPREDALAYKYDGKWKKYSTDEFLNIANNLSAGLLALGLQKGDKIGLISSNRPEWNFCDIGMLQIGCVNVPVYPTISRNEYKYIFNDAQIKLVFVEDQGLLDKILDIKDEVPSLQHIYSFNKLDGAKHYTEITDLATDDFKKQVDEIKNGIDPEELASLIYTSGTTGTPKGVMLLHRNIVSNIKSVYELIPLDSTKRALSFLPMCHIFERTVSYTYLSKGTAIWYAESIEKLGDNLREVKPNYFSTVPRLLEKVYENKILPKGTALTGVKQKLFNWALNLGFKYDINDRSPLYNIKIAIARKLVFGKIVDGLGGNVEGIMTGAAKMREDLGRLFNAFGIHVREGYGLTETSPVLTFNRFDESDARMGTVGVPVPNVEIKIADDGEILAKGPNIMAGYYNKPEATAEVMTGDWFHTGDIGVWENYKGKKFLKITDRKKALFKTSGGKYVAPANIESKFKESPFIDQMIIIGNDRKFVSALIVPVYETLRNYCKENGLPCESNEQMISHPAVIEKYKEIQVATNPNFGKVEQVKKFTLMPNEWTVDTGELTPTMKLKRKIVCEKYCDQIEAMYAG